MEWLLDTSGFLPRSHCGNWPDWLVTLTVACNCVFVASYYWIPLCLFWLWRKKRGVLPSPKILLLFVAFIFLCGTAHLMDALMFSWPAYRLNSLIVMLGAAVSFTTAVMMPRAVMHLASLPTPEELRAEAVAREAALTEKAAAEKRLIAANQRIKDRAANLKSLIESKLWEAESKTELAELRANFQLLLSAEIQEGTA